MRQAAKYKPTGQLSCEKSIKPKILDEGGFYVLATLHPCGFMMMMMMMMHSIVLHAKTCDDLH